jgi:hypothetical protein
MLLSIHHNCAVFPAAVLQALRVAAAESEANRFAAAEQHLQQAQAEVEAAERLGGARQVRDNTMQNGTARHWGLAVQLVMMMSNCTALLLLPLLQAYSAQLANMTSHIRAVQFATQQEKSMASTRMAACSASMAKQRCAGVGFTSAAAPIPRSGVLPQAAMMHAGAAGSDAPGFAPPAGAANCAAAAPADFMQQQEQEEGAAVPWAKSNVMRMKMTSNAADYFSKRNKK